MAERTVSVKLQARVDQYVGGMKKASVATKQLETATEKARKEQYLMSKTAGIVGAAVVAAFVGKTIKAASDLNETMSKTNVVFKQNAAAVAAWSKTSATAFGMSQNAAAGAAATYGNLFVSLGLADDQASEMSMRLVELAGDLASFNNVDPTEALDALRSGLVGETEPLKRFGVNMNEATLKAQALKMGLVATTKEALDPAVKAQAAYALILEQTTTAQGDFARTSDGLANQQRILNAEWENAQAGLGQALLPAATEALKVFNGLLGVFNGLPDGVKATALGIGLVGAATVLALPKLVAFKVALGEIGVSTGGIGSKLKGLGSVVAGPWGIALAGATIALGAYMESQANAKAAVDALTESMDAQTGAATAQTFEVIAQALAADIALEDWEKIPFTLAEVTSALANGGTELTDLQQRMDAFVASNDGGNASMMESAYVVKALGSSMQNQSEVIYDARNAWEAHKAATEAAASASGSTETAIDGVGGAAADAATDVAALNDALSVLKGFKGDVDSALADMEASFDDAAAAVKGLEGATRKNGAALDLTTPAGRKAQDALDKIRDSAFGAAEKMGAAGWSAKAVGEQMQTARANFIKTAEAAGINGEAAETLADQYGLIPSQIVTAYKTTGAGKAEQDAKDIAKAQDEIRRLVQIRYDSGIVGPRPDRRASGGYIKGPGSGTSDSIPAYLSNGEYVVRASSVRKYGRGTFDALNAGRYASGGMARRRGRVGGRRFDFGDYADIRDSQRGAASLDFDFSAYGQAVDRAKNAALALVDARRRVNEASSPEEQAQAQRDLAAATLEVADAEKAKAAAKPTGKNILASFRDRAKRLDTFRKNLRTLAKKGLSGVILRQLLEAGIDEGGEMAAALVKDPSIIGDLNRTQSAINGDASALAGMFGGRDGSAATGGTSGGTSGTSGSTSDGIVIGFENASKPIVLKVEGQQVWQALLKVKKARGGASLGLG